MLRLLAVALIYIAVFGIAWGIAIPIAFVAFGAGSWLTLFGVGHELVSWQRSKRLHAAKGQQNFTHDHPLSPEVHLKPKQQFKPFLWGRAQDSGQVTSKFDRRLTGSSVIDAELNITIDAAFKIHVEPWFTKLFEPYLKNNAVDWLETDEVIHELRLSINKMIIALANPCKDADVAQYLTTTLVNDFATHVRIFKRAKEFAPFRPPTTHNARDPYSTVLVANFFKAEPRTPAVCLGGTPESPESRATTASVSREQVSCDKSTMRDYLLYISDMLFYLLADRNDFNCTLHRELFNEIFTTAVLLPTMDVLSQPDTVNRILLWLLQDVECDIDSFLLVIRSPETTRDELQAIREQVEHEMDVHRAKDCSTEESVKEVLKAQLQSLEYLQRLIDRKMRGMPTNSTGSTRPGSVSATRRPEEAWMADNDSSTVGVGGKAARDAAYYQRIDKLTPIQHLGLQDVLSNNVALSYFIDFLQVHDTHHMLFFYLTIEGFRMTAIQDDEWMPDGQNDSSNAGKSQESQNSVVDPTAPTSTMQRSNIISNKQSILRDTAISIFDQYLSDKAIHPLTLYIPAIKRSGEVRRLWTRILNDPPQHTMFDNLQQKVYMRLNDECFPAFRAAPQYWHMLGDLDLLRGNGSGSVPPKNAAAAAGNTTAEAASNAPNVFKNLFDAEHSCSTAASSLSDAAESQQIPGAVSGSHATDRIAADKTAPSAEAEWSVSAELTSAKIAIDKRRGNTKYATYRIEVTHHVSGSTSTQKNGRIWETFRRYSEFHDLHQRIQRRFANLHGLSFPGKEMNNLRPDVMERRKRSLALYLHTLLYRDVLNSNKGLLDLMLIFLAPGDYNPSLIIAASDVTTVADPAAKNIAKPVLLCSSPVILSKQTKRPQQVATNVLSDSAQSVKRNVKMLSENVLQLSSNMSSQFLNSLSGLLASPSNASQHMPYAAARDNITSTVNADDEQALMQNIPLRIMLLLMDEVFDLRNRNQWLRNRIIGMLSALVRATLGDAMNRKIVQFVDFSLSPEKLASYVASLRELLLTADTSATAAAAVAAGRSTMASKNPAASRDDVTSMTSSDSASGRGILNACLGPEGNSAAMNTAAEAEKSEVAAERNKPRRRTASETHDDNHSPNPPSINVELVTETKQKLARSRSQFYHNRQQHTLERSSSSSSLFIPPSSAAVTESVPFGHRRRDGDQRREKRQHSADAVRRSSTTTRPRQASSLTRGDSAGDAASRTNNSNGAAADGDKDADEKLRCQIKVLVKAKMLSLMMSQFQNILGTRTVQLGTFTLFDIFQYPALNVRLLTILIEGCLQLLFAHNSTHIAKRLRTFHEERHKLRKPVVVQSSKAGGGVVHTNA